jgi:hypothetical protein
LQKLTYESCVNFQVFRDDNETDYINSSSLFPKCKEYQNNTATDEQCENLNKQLNIDRVYFLYESISWRQTLTNFCRAGLMSRAAHEGN